jgi:hypothetical protein
MELGPWETDSHSASQDIPHPDKSPPRPWPCVTFHNVLISHGGSPSLRTTPCRLSATHSAYSRLPSTSEDRDPLHSHKATFTWIGWRLEPTSYTDYNESGQFSPLSACPGSYWEGREGAPTDTLLMDSATPHRCKRYHTTREVLCLSFAAKSNSTQQSPS